MKRSFLMGVLAIGALAMSSMMAMAASPVASPHLDYALGVHATAHASVDLTTTHDSAGIFDVAMMAIDPPAEPKPGDDGGEDSGPAPSQLIHSLVFGYHGKEVRALLGVDYAS